MSSPAPPNHLGHDLVFEPAVNWLTFSGQHQDDPTLATTLLRSLSVRLHHRHLEEMRQYLELEFGEATSQRLLASTEFVTQLRDKWPSIRHNPSACHLMTTLSCDN